MTEAATDPLDAPRSFRPAAARLWILLPLAGAAFLAWFPLYSGDLWMHLASAREILARGTVPREEIFLYTAEGRRWINHSWGAQLVFYGVFRLGEILRGAGGGPGAIVLLRALLTGAGVGVFWLHAVRRGARQATAAGVALALLPISLPYLLARPLLLMPLLAGGLLLLLARPTAPRVAAAVLIQILWANLHASAPLGPVIALALAAEATLGTRLRWLAPDAGLVGQARRLWLATGLLLAATLINPNHVHVYLYAWELRQLDWVSRDIREWRPPRMLHPDYRHALVAMILVWGAVLLQIARRGRARLADLLLLALVTLQAITARRFLMLWAFFALPVGALAVSVCVARSARVRRLVAAALLLLGGLLVADDVIDRVRKGNLRAEADADAAPLAAVRFLREHGVRGNVACAPYAGGAVHWALPGAKAATDGRCLVNDPDVIRAWNALANNRPGWEAAVPAPGVSDVMLFETAYLSPVHRLYPDWGVAYWDERWEVWLRRNGAYADLLHANDLTPSAPHIAVPLYDLLGPEEKGRMMEQLGRRVREEPENGLAQSLLGHVLYRQAVEWLGILTHERVARLRAESPEVAARFDRRAREALREALTRLDASLRLFRGDQRLNPRQSRAHYGAARSLLWLGRPREAGAAFRRAARIDPLNWLHARDAILYYLEFLDAVEEVRAPVGQETLRLLETVTRAARAERSAIEAVFRRMNRLSNVPDWLYAPPPGGEGAPPHPPAGPPPPGGGSP